MPSGQDLYQYKTEIDEQFQLVKAQGETLGLTISMPPWMEQSLLLIAAWQLPQYRKIALDYTMDGKVVSVEALMREFEKQRLLTAHLNQAGSKGDRRQERNETRVHQASAWSEVLLCFPTGVLHSWYGLRLSP
jgi:hypothetical protein